MKLILFTLVTLFSVHAFATIDTNARVYIVVQHVQDNEEFFVERVPIIGCYGLVQGPQLVAFTQEYKVPSSVGCGSKQIEENINYLTCAKVVSFKESEDFVSFSEITLDISKCEAKNNPKFITMLRTAAKLNFPQSDKKKEVKLTLIK